MSYLNHIPDKDFDKIIVFLNIPNGKHNYTTFLNTKTNFKSSDNVVKLFIN